MDQIAESAGVGKGTVYLYFRSKQELYFAIMEHDLEELHAGTVRKWEERRLRIRAYMRVRCEFAESRHDFLGFCDRISDPRSSRNQHLPIDRVTYPERSRLLLKQFSKTQSTGARCVKCLWTQRRGCFTT